MSVLVRVWVRVPMHVRVPGLGLVRIPGLGPVPVSVRVPMPMHVQVPGLLGLVQIPGLGPVLVPMQVPGGGPRVPEPEVASPRRGRRRGLCKVESVLAPTTGGLSSFWVLRSPQRAGRQGC